MGAGWGVKILGGEWWRLVTPIFVHHLLYHVLSNLIFLWFFGKRLERILGRWSFLVFYLICGVAGNVVTLAVNPEAQSYGASGAVYGLAGGLVGAYGLKVKYLSRREWWKLALLALSIAWSIYVGFSDPVIDHFTQINNYAHIGGLLAGLVLGAALTSVMTQTTQRRLRVFAGMAVVLLLGVISIRHYNSYVVHLNSASRALDKGSNAEAVKELHIALRMKPNSKAARYLAREWENRNGPKDACSSLLANRPSQGFRDNVCKGVECDGAFHLVREPDGRARSYQGTVETSAPNPVDGILQSTTTAALTIQTLDEFGEIACTVEWTTVTKRRVDAEGVASGVPLSVTQSERTVSESDPKATYLHDRALQARP